MPFSKGFAFFGEALVHCEREDFATDRSECVKTRKTDDARVLFVYFLRLKAALRLRLTSEKASHVEPAM